MSNQKITALYCRLSQEDMRQGESDRARAAAYRTKTEFVKVVFYKSYKLFKNSPRSVFETRACFFVLLSKL